MDMTNDIKRMRESVNAICAADDAGYVLVADPPAVEWDEAQCLLDVWRKSRGDSFPSRQTILQAMAGVDASGLAVLCVIPRDDETRDFRYLSSGSAIEQVFGFLKGRMLSELDNRPWCRRAEFLLNTTVDAGLPVLGVSERVLSSEYGFLKSKSLAVPLSDDGSNITGIAIQLRLQVQNGANWISM